MLGPKLATTAATWMTAFLAAVTAQPTPAAQPVWLIDAKSPAAGWGFGNGPEFPGATGSLGADEKAAREGRPALKLVGDFSKGGNYVQAGRKIDSVDIRDLTMWVRNGGSDRITLRINDATGQCHQIALKTESMDGWQQILLPLEQFFARRSEAGAVGVVAKYEYWGGANDGLWHGPAKALYILIGSHADRSRLRELWINDLAIVPRPAEAVGEEIRSTVRLDEIVEGTHDWRFTRGEEFKGAKGSLETADKGGPGGQPCFRLSGDFTGGGAYVAMIRPMQDLEAKDTPTLRLRYKTDNARNVTILLNDATGQAHQRKGVGLQADGQWHELIVKPAEIAGGEHWGGANDGKWHGPASQFVLSVTTGSDERDKKPALLVADVRAELLRSVFVQDAAYACDFEGAVKLPAGWSVEGGVSVEPAGAASASACLVLYRSVEDAQKPCSATSPSFPAAAGKWELALRCRADLHSPDNSYSASVQLECLDAGRKVIDRLALADVFGKHDWQRISRRVELPAGTALARFHVQFNKTYGSFRLDDLSAAYLASLPLRDGRISRLLFSTAALGNLLLPGDPRRVDIRVETRKPLRSEQQSVRCVLRDYWGAEQAKPWTIDLGPMAREGRQFVYKASLDLGAAGLEIGRYYELHAEIPQPGEEPFANYTSLAILPEAPAKALKPEDVPFTSRSWDNRSNEHVKLTDRLGIRVCGIWGGWSSKEPYKPTAPQLDLVRKLGMGWLTGTPAATIERGQTDYDEQALRQGVRNLIQTYGNVRPMIINLGNEPHGTGEVVRRNVEAYRVLYEEIKKVDPTITVVATSVEPNEEYFRLGYGRWCDAYDFHVYADGEALREEMRRYQALARKYDHVKPLWSTELGLNSQGMTRHAVACEVIRKTATFFACGGVNMSWFGLVYGDPQAKLHGTAANSHNLFDCRYNRHCPRLDAIALYNAVNAVSSRKFRCERLYEGGLRAFLFDDGRGDSLQVLWAGKAGRDVAVPLAGAEDVLVVRIDGSRRTLKARGGSVTLSINEDPLLLLYKREAQGSVSQAKLPELLLPAAAWDDPPRTISTTGPTTLGVKLGQGLAASQVELIAPPFWSVKKESTDASLVRFTLTPPPDTGARECDLAVRIGPPDAPRGELYLRRPMAD
ncbi:MAG: hypothetical protein BWX88_01257 [Planctomycetes bacterium ADurb.Bin126]|nr:MAG: hypothetical protein BWX88_01257 [Planctomycetes bacterium ADurb.Bin126]HOD84034.1 hypothetical protein [Phycisphaerae bacterium]HQL74478.1 hypothetical protein [Phycisphaerae bacterium]